MKYSRLLLVLLLLFGLLSFSNRMVSAISEDVVIFQLQTGKTGAANEEFILLYNTSAEDINISDWCVQYSSAKIAPTLENFNTVGCLAPPPQTELWLSAGGYASFARAEFLTANPSFIQDAMLTGGSMAGTSGIVRLINKESIEKDRVAYRNTTTTTDYAETLPAIVHASGQVLSRTLTNTPIDTDNNSLDFTSQPIMSAIMSGLFEVEVLIDLCTNIDGLQSEVPVGYMEQDGGCYFDICPNLDDLQISLPYGYILDADSECKPIPLENRTIFITELYPDAPSYDTGQEFVELYNPNDTSINMKGYKLQVGPSFSQEFVFGDVMIPALSYMIFSDSETGIVLPNTTGVQLRLVAPAGNSVSLSNSYQNAEDTLSWALVDDMWIFTNQITPNGANKPYVESAQNEVVGVTSVLAPCPAGKYRNPETNRCRTIETAVSLLAPCDEDEYRSTTTNRCRKANSVNSSLQPCDAGEERNLETNRCRKVSTLGVKSQSDIAEVADSKVENIAGKPNWGVLSVTTLGTVGYMLYEWRRELKMKLYRVKIK